MLTERDVCTLFLEWKIYVDYRICVYVVLPTRLKNHENVSPPSCYNLEVLKMH